MQDKNPLEPEKPIISVKEARKIMGKRADKLTDGQIEKLVNDLDMIALLQLELVPNTSI